MRVLGIHPGHNASPALLESGVVVAAVQEDRLRRVKNCGGVPAQAIAEVIRVGGLRSIDAVDRVAIAGCTLSGLTYLAIGGFLVHKQGH